MNPELAREYLALVGSMGRVSSQHQRYATAIEHATVDFQTHYGQCGGLGKLQVKGVGREAMTALELILRKGKQGALRTLRDMHSTRALTRLEARLK